METVDAVSTIELMIALLASYPRKRVIHLFLDNAEDTTTRSWCRQQLARPGCRIKLHFIPTYSAHLDPIERLWAMHRAHAHNTCRETFKDFREAILTFLPEEVPKELAPLLRWSRTTSTSSRPRIFGFWRERNCATFVASSMLQFVISVIGVLLFTGLTAYGTQRIKEIYFSGRGATDLAKLGLMGALTLYLDFIDLFVMLLQPTGERRER